MSYFEPQEVTLVKSSQNTVIREQFPAAGPEADEPALTISIVAPAFLDWTRYEMRRSRWTVERYHEALGWVVRDIGDLPVAGIHLGHLLELRRRMEERGCGEARMASILNSLRSLLKFCRGVLHVRALDPRQVRIPRIPRRQVIYLTKEEIARLREAIIRGEERWQDVALSKLRFRALVEVLLGTGARIAEILSLDRYKVDFERREARIIGKGNKERTIFFTDLALEWVRRYLSRRWDDEEPLFVSGDPPRRLIYAATKSSFQRITKRAGVNKKITAHILRHTMATTLLFNGCPIGHIRVLLGHERLDTTCQYYLGLDLRGAKEAHEKFLSYD